MKFTTQSMAAAAVALLIAGCGGGGSGDVATQPDATPPAVTPPAASLQLSGTAATGKALAAASVQVKCATGSGSATTDASGAYTVSLEGGALPCMIEVTGSANDVQVTLHSVTEAGSTDASSNRTSAVANVTPLTEIVVAHLTGGLPAAVFAAFDASSATQITTEKLGAATTTVLDTLKGATGLDFGTIDPFKATLVPATGAAQGNDYDQLLDQLGTKVAPEALPQVVTQVAAAAASGDSTGLQDAMASVDAGSLPNCPAVVSGKYRILEYFGASYVRVLNFKAMTISRPDGTGTLPLTVDAANPCGFVAAGLSANNTQVELTFSMNASGVGALNIQNLTASRRNIALVFPEQSHTASELVGDWTFHQGGYIPGEGLGHKAGQFHFAADGKVQECKYAIGTSDWSTCTPDATSLTTVARSDGGFDFMNGTVRIGSVWGYRAPSGTLSLFATTNEAGSVDPAVAQVALELFKPAVQQLPVVGSTTKYWDVSLTRLPNAGAGQNNTSVTPDANTILSVDSAAANVVRKRASDGREDTVQYNVPTPGLRFRAPTPTISGVYQFPLPGTGIVVSVNSVPTGTHLYNVSVVRP
jgi:hypothetical protein